MPVNDSVQHVVRTSAQWDERAIEFWVVPRGCLCVELTPDGKTKIKIGEGNKFYSQLPYITSEGDLANYYTKTEIDNLLTNLNRMAIQSTEEYDSKNDLPLTGNKLGDVRFVKSASPSIKTDPDVYVWNDTKWIYVGYDFSQIDLSEYVKKEEFEPVKEKVDEMYPLRHTHDNKEILDQVEVAFKVVDKNKLDSLENYDDTEVKNRLTNVENKAHVHNNMQILNMTTAAFTIPDKNKLDSLRNYDVFRGTNGVIPGTIGLVPAPQPVDVGKVLGADGRWVDVDVAPFTGATATTDGESGLVPAPLAGEQAKFLRGDGIWAKVKTGDKYRAGDGIAILSGEVISDTFPFQVLPQAEQVTQYIIYGAPGGVGDAVTGGYRIQINASAEGHTDRSATVIIPDKLYEGDYVDYQKQVYSTYRTNVTSRVSADPNYNYDYGIYSDGRIARKDPGAYGGYPRVTALFELEPGASYEITAYNDYDGWKFENAMHINLYDADQNVTRTIAQSYSGNTTFTPAPTDKYMRFAYREDIWSWIADGRQTVWQLKNIERPCGLPELFLYPGVVNTINATTTVKPSLMYIEIEPPDDPESEDPMSEFTGIIYNDGVLDVTQEDPNAMNELTVHFRNDTTTLILPVTEEMTGASGSTDGTGGTVPAPLAGEQTYFLRGDGVWAKVKQEGDKYKAGDGIYIMSAETVIDSFPAEFYSRSNKLKNYIIYGNTGGVGEYESTSGKYLIPIKITAEGETAVTNNIVLTAKLYPGDYIDYGNQTFVHTRTPVATPIVGRGKAIDSNGDVMSSSAYAVTQCCATDFIPVSSEFSYELTPTYDPISSYLSPRFHALYDENQICTRTIPANYNSTIQITPAANEKYMRITGGTEYHGQVMVMPTVTQIGPVVETTLIPSIGTYPNVVNTIDILTTVKPSSVFIEATPDEEDPDDPSTAFTGIIYNEGVLDVTQEDPNALNELTIHFRESDKVITIPAGGSTYTAGDGIDIDANNEISAKLGSGLQFDANGAIEVTGGGGGSYTPGNGINITNDEISVKIGDGLSFDNNDAITVDEMTGASALADGASGTVPAPLAGDDAKFLRGDGSWAEIETSTKYVEGDAIEFGHPGMTDLGFDFDTFVSKFTTPNNGTVSIDSANKAFTLTATGSDCYTSPWTGESVYTIPVIGGRKYRLTWDSNAPNVSGSVYAFENADTSHMHSVNQANQNYLEFTADTNSNINFRFGVRDAGNSITYSNIKFYEVDNADPDTNIINVKYGNGLSLDNNNTLQVDGMVGATSQTAGTGGTVPAPSAGDENKFLSGGGIWSNPPTYTLPVATTSTLGGVKVGAGLSMNANDELGVTSPYVTSVANQGSVPGVITVTKSDGISTDVDILENLRLILNCNYDSSQNQTQLGEPVNAPNAGNSMGSSIIGDLTVLEVT